MLEASGKLAASQRAFAAHIRDPGGNPPPADVAPRRMAMYRELFFNNVESFLSGNFPVLRSLYGDAAWHELAQDFFARHRCRTPYFHAIPKEFLAFLRDERGEQPGDPPFLRELAHYEWVETAVAMAQGEAPPALNGEGLNEPLALSELAWPLAYRWPVHKIGPASRPEQPPAEPTLLVVYRNREDRVAFLEINPVTHRLLELLQAEPGQTGAVYLNRVAAELHHPDPDAVLRHGIGILAALAEREAIGRSRPNR